MRQDEAVTSDLDLEEPGRRLIRGEPVIAKVLSATIEELALVGLEGMTLERVAARAAVNRTTIYRRWPTKDDLVLAALRWMEKDEVLPDTGTLRGDLEKLIEHATAKLFAPGTLSLIRTILGAPSDSKLREFAECTHEVRRRGVLELFERAERRGEIRADIDKELFLDSIFGMLFVRLIFKREQPTTELRDRIVNQVLRLAAPQSPVAPARPRPSRPKPRRTPAAKKKPVTKARRAR
jgi:AcrR family transcriptional regulator